MYYNQFLTCNFHKPAAYFTCKRLGIPYDPSVRGEWRRNVDIPEVNELENLDVRSDSDSEIAECSNNQAELREFIPTERETWILDADYLEKSYLMSGDPNPESLAWNIDTYESAWISVGLILNDEAFKHVSCVYER